MTIKTLEYIHRLLKSDVEERKEEYENLGKPEYLKIAEDSYKTLHAAQDALGDFEAHEWR